MNLPFNFKTYKTFLNFEFNCTFSLIECFSFSNCDIFNYETRKIEKKKNYNKKYFNHKKV